MHVFYVLVQVYVCVFDGCACEPVHVVGPRFTFGLFLDCSSPLFSETGPLINLVLINLATGWPMSLRNLPVSTCPQVMSQSFQGHSGVRGTATRDFSGCVLESKQRSLCLLDRSYTN